MDWLSLSPDERHRIVIKERETALITSRRARLAIFIMAVPFLLVSLSTLIVNVMNRSGLVSILGFILGISLAVIGALVISANRIKSFTAILSDDFSDNDVIAYLREKDDVSKRFLDRLKRPISILALLYIGMVFVFMVIYRPPEFAIMVGTTGLGFVSLFALVITRRQRTGRRSDERANTGST